MDEYNLYINKNYLKEIKQISDGSVILSQEGGVICGEGNWEANNDENNYITNNKIMFLCVSTNFLYNKKMFWAKRVNGNTIIAKPLDGNERIIIKQSNKIKKLDKSVFLCAHYVKGENHKDSVLSAVNSAVITIENQYVCASCNKSIVNNCVFYLKHPYHEGCVKCKMCDKKLNTHEEINDFVSIAKGLFLCKEHYEQILTSNQINDELKTEYEQKIKDNFVEEVFNDSIFSNEDIIDYPPEAEVFITPEILKESVQKISQKPYEDFIPTMKLEFNIKPQDMNYDKLREFLGDDAIILGIEKGLTILKIALLSIEDLGQDIKKKYNDFANNLKTRINKAIADQPVVANLVGKLVGEPDIKIPTNEQIKNAINRPSFNHLQISISLDEMEIDKIKKKVFDKLKNEKGKDDWEFIFKHADLYDEMEKQIREDLKNSPYELTIVGQTVIADKFFEEYEQIKNIIPKQNLVERFLYHGSKLENHIKIVQEHFTIPGVDKMKQTDPGYYGKGIYATENLFYASMYSNGCNVLGINQKSYVICCRAIYDQSKQKEIKDLSYYDKPTDDDITDNYGINHVIVGSSTSPQFLPIDEQSKEQNNIYAEEFVFPNKCQLIPFCSFTIMRKDYFIIWKDDNMENNENSNYLEQLSSMGVILYPVKTVEEAIDIIKRKKHSNFKLITNGGGPSKSGEKLIKEARSITGNEFICLVFAQSEEHLNWISDMKNVLYTQEFEKVKAFIEVKMNYKEVCKYISNLKYRSKLSIDEFKLWDFPKDQIIKGLSQPPPNPTPCNLS